MPILSRKSSKSESPTGIEQLASAYGFSVYDGASDKESRRRSSSGSPPSSAIASFFPRFNMGARADRHTGRGEQRKDRKGKRASPTRQPPNLDRFVPYIASCQDVLDSS